MTPQKLSLSLDVADVAPAGCRSLEADVFVPAVAVNPSTLWICIPGGGINRQYFDLDVHGADHSFSMAMALAAKGHLVATIDPPGVGGSDSPFDGYQLSPQVTARVLAKAIEVLRQRIDDGEVGDAPADSPTVVIGLGHSAGALLTAVVQAHHNSYDALALLGFSASGLPSVLNERELSFSGRPELLAAVLAELARDRFGDALPQWSNHSSGEEDPAEDTSAVDAALSKATSNLLALVGMSAIIPGSVQPELDQISVPVFAALGQHDLAGSLNVLPGQLPACGDLTLFLVEGAGHTHNIAANRHVLWDRLMRWAMCAAPCG